jgi:hypothetical protein
VHDGVADAHVDEWVHSALVVARPQPDLRGGALCLELGLCAVELQGSA